MPWWGWLVIGVVLMGAELTAVDAAFYLVFIGLAAVVLGLLELGGVEMTVAIQWLTFAGLALTLMVLFRRRLYEKLRGRTQPLTDPMIDRWVKVSDDVPPGQSTRIDLQGTQWTAYNAGTDVIPAQSTARVVSTEGLAINIIGQNQ